MEAIYLTATGNFKKSNRIRTAQGGVEQVVRTGNSVYPASNSKAYTSSKASVALLGIFIT